ncbi:MAG: nitroreductase [Syntrophomonadales bacterium]|jgi:nitroreductase
MKVSEALKSRFTCRGFKPDPIEAELIMKILEPASRAPSWANSQPWEIYVATGDTLNRIREGFLQGFESGHPPRFEQEAPQQWPEHIAQRIAERHKEREQLIGPADPEAKKAMMRNNFRFFGAPAVVYLCMDRGLSNWSLFDLGAISQSIMLAAREEGVDSAPAVMLVSYPDLIRSEMGIPDHLKIVFGIALGYADPDFPLNRIRAPRRPIQEIVTFKR